MKLTTSGVFFRNLTMIYFAQAGMLVAFSGVVFFLVESGQLGEPDHHLALMFQKIIIVIVPLSMFGAYFVFKVALRQLPPNASLPQKLNKYFVAVMIRSAMLEVPGLLIATMAFITSQSLLLIVIPLVLLVFLLMRPTPASAASDLNLSHDEKNKLIDPESRIGK